MLPKPANDNTPRPAAFDAAVMAYMPGLTRLARRYTKTTEQRDDLVNDTVMYALERWKNFRGDPSESRGGFWAWLTWQMRGLVKSASVKAAFRRRTITFVSMEAVVTTPSTPASQEENADLSVVFRCAAGVKHGDVLIRRAMGEHLQVIADERGLSRERVRQIETEAREQVVDAIGWGG
ncbi:sigma-70 family RNA polymerase sigma factor [Corticibacterium sp. UT-5YL-CI-8]|nr:sigma-70 family RNA polymerase sigma factor [Tianweitania sp. UT-5YL-CI-8]